MDLSNKIYTQEELKFIDKLLEEPEDGFYTEENSHCF